MAEGRIFREFDEDPAQAGYALAIRDVVEALRRDWSGGNEFANFIESRFGSPPDEEESDG